MELPRLGGCGGSPVRVPQTDGPGAVLGEEGVGSVSDPKRGSAAHVLLKAFGGRLVGADDHVMRVDVAPVGSRKNALGARDDRASAEAGAHCREVFARELGHPVRVRQALGHAQPERVAAVQDVVVHVCLRGLPQQLGSPHADEEVRRAGRLHAGLAVLPLATLQEGGGRREGLRGLGALQAAEGWQAPPRQSLRGRAARRTAEEKRGARGPDAVLAVCWVADAKYEGRQQGQSPTPCHHHAARRCCA
mmetsp:Transcript_8379/g.21361  ORF Transcript_8379/g.21361 Transcript_8379/m.21361 type:complete len:248 (-) Transcript_8379:129-872(-)